MSLGQTFTEGVAVGGLRGSTSHPIGAFGTEAMIGSLFDVCRSTI